MYALVLTKTEENFGEKRLKIELEIGDFVSLIRPYGRNCVNLLNEDHTATTDMKFNYGEVALILAADENPHCYIIIRCYKVLCQEGVGWIGESWLKRI